MTRYQVASQLIEALTSYYSTRRAPMEETIAHFIQQMQADMRQVQDEDDPRLRDALGPLAEAASEVDDPRVQELVGQAKALIAYDPIDPQELLRRGAILPADLRWTRETWDTSH